MKVLFWVFAVLSVVAGLFISFVVRVSQGLGLIGTGFGNIVCYAGLAAVGVGIFGVILGVIAALLMIFLKDSIGKYVLWLLMAEMFVMCVTIIIIDLLVKNLFDENGVRVR